jgi:hypothetical protein
VVSTGLFAVNSFLGGLLARWIGAPFTIWLSGATIVVVVGAFIVTGTVGVITDGLSVRAEGMTTPLKVDDSKIVSP